MRSAPVRRVSLLLAVVAVVAAGCGWLQPALSAEELEHRTTAVLEGLPVEPIGEDFGVTSEQDRGRDRPCGRPPAQIPACAANALGSSLGYDRQIARWARDVGRGLEVSRSQRWVPYVPS
jgi:hypothetical protein